MCYSHMLRYILAALLSLALFPPATAQVLRADAEEKSLGEMRPLDRRELTFVLHNIAGDTVRLDAPRPSCGCTASMLDRSVLGPGDSAAVSVAFTATPGMLGNVNKSVSIYGHVGGSQSRLMVLRIRGEIVADLRPEPGALRFSAVIGDTVRLEAVLRSNSDLPVRIENVTAAITAYVDTSEGNTYHVDRIQAHPFTDFRINLGRDVVEPGDSTRLMIILHPHAKGQINGNIEIPLRNTVLRIPVIGAVLRQRE